MSTYAEEIVRLVTEESAKPVSHKKVLEPLCNMVASVLAGINHEHDVDDREHFKAQLDKMFDQYAAAYAIEKSKAN